MMDIDKKTAMTPSLSDEHQRRWDDDLMTRKTDSPEHNYDPSRMRLNFQVAKGGKITPIDTSKKDSLTADLNALNQKLADGKISLDAYNQQKGKLQKQLFDCDNKLADKQQKVGAKQAELSEITAKVNYYDVACVRFDIPSHKLSYPHIDRPSRLANLDEWTAQQNKALKEHCDTMLHDFGKTVMDAASASVVKERKMHLYDQKMLGDLGNSLRASNAAYENLKKDVGEFLSLLETEDLPKVSEVATALILGTGPVYVPCSGGGSVSSNDGWRDRDKDEDCYLFRLRCWLHAGKIVKSARATSRSRGYSRH